MKSPGWRTLAIVGWLLAIGAVVKVVQSTRGTPTPVPFRFPIELPDSVGVANGVGIKLALSRDGSQLAVIGMKEGHKALYLRRSDDIQAKLVPGTDSAFNPSFSPDGQWLLFQSGSRLLKVQVGQRKSRSLDLARDDNNPDVVMDSARAASWGDDGFIVYEKGNALWRVSATGGEARRVATPDANERFRRYSFPEVLPGSKDALITVWRGSTNLDSARLATVSLADGRVTDLGIRGANAHYVAPGFVLFAQVGGAVAAVPFSLRKLAATGPVIPLLENVYAGDGGGTDFSAADNGVLAYHGGIADAGLVTMLAVDRAGKERQLPLVGRERFLEPRLSPDGRHIAVSIGPPPPSATGDIWVYDLATGQRKQVSTAGVNIRPEWTRDGTRVVYISKQADSQFVVSRRWDGTGEPEILARGVSPAFYELSMGPAHGWSAIRTGLAPGGSAIRIVPTDSFSHQRVFDTPRQVVVTPMVSPNGRLIAYVAPEAGRREVFVRPISGSAREVAVSKDGGSEPAWSADGGTLFFRSLTHLMSAPVVERDTLVVGPPVALFPDKFRLSVAHTGYDVFPSGRELLMLGGWGRDQSRAYVVVNWMETMRKTQSAP